jgi:hypothetical protein
MTDWIFPCTMLAMVLGHWLADILPGNAPEAWYSELSLEALKPLSDTRPRP